jgi:hypothetical protein
LKHTLYQKEEEEEEEEEEGEEDEEGTNLSLKPKEQAIDLLKLTEGNVRSSKRVDDTESHARSR